MQVRTGPAPKIDERADIAVYRLRDRMIDVRTGLRHISPRRINSARKRMGRIRRDQDGPDTMAGSGAASLRMSIRQPVSRAANRAFCPSLPMANDS